MALRAGSVFQPGHLIALERQMRDLGIIDYVNPEALRRAVIGVDQSLAAPEEKGVGAPQ